MEHQVSRSSESRIVYRPRADARPEHEANALAAVYGLILDSAKRRGRLSDKSGPNDAMKGSSNDRADTILPRE